MRRLVLAGLLCLAAFLHNDEARAADPVFIEMTIDQPSRLTVGERVQYTFVVEVDGGTQVALAPAALPPEVALVDPPQETRVPLPNGREQVTLSLEVAPFVVGEVELPPLPLRYSSPDGSSGTLQGNASVLNVSSILPASGQVQPRGLKPQAQIGTPPAGWVTPAIVAAAAGLAVLLLALLLRIALLQARSRRRNAAPVVLMQPQGPEDLARNALDEAGAAFGADGDYTAYYRALGTAVRTYLSERHGFPAFALTTRELEEAMIAKGIDRWQVRVTAGLLNQCDAVVYASYRPAAERADADLTAAYEIIEITRPEEEQAVDEQVVVS